MKFWSKAIFLIIIFFHILTSVSLSQDFEDFDLLQVTKDGLTLEYKTTAKKAASGYRYKTVGFYIHSTKSNGNPDQLYPAEAVHLWIEPNKCRDIEQGGDLVMVRCEIPLMPDWRSINTNEYINSFIGTPDWYNNPNFSENEIYASPIFITSNSNGVFPEPIRYTGPITVGNYIINVDNVIYRNSYSRTYNNYNAILNALPNGYQWSTQTQNYLRSYYDKKLDLEYTPLASTVHKFRVIADSGFIYPEDLPYADKLNKAAENNAVLSSSLVPPDPQNRHPAGDPYWILNSTGLVGIEPIFTKDNVQYKLVGSEVRYIHHPEHNITLSANQYAASVTARTQAYVVSYYVPDIPEENSGPTPQPTPGPGSSGGSPSASCPAPQSSNTTVGFMQAGANGQLGSDPGGNFTFTVSQGIPTSERLYARVTGRQYLFDGILTKYTGKCTYQVKVSRTYSLSWQSWEIVGYEPRTPNPDGTFSGGGPIYDWVPKSGSKTVDRYYTVERDYSFWTINKFDVYKIDKAEISNYAFPGDKVVITPKGYNVPGVITGISPNWYDHIQEPIITDVVLPSKSVNGQEPPVEDWTHYAEESVGQVKVRNDRLVFNNSVVLDDSVKDTTTPSPNTTPLGNPPQIDNNVLYASGILIPREKQNSQNNPTTGTLTYVPYYSATNTATERSFNIPGFSAVSIHTPVVNYSHLPDENSSYDQSVNPGSGTPLVLGRTFTINFTESGQHRSIPGYYNRDYSKYTSVKRVRFPFDVFVGNNFYSANTWINIPIGQHNTVFRLPEWVPEGNYTFRTESWAENTPPGNNSCQLNSNTNFPNYCAYKEFGVKVVGRLYGFRIFDVGDLRFEEVFRTSKGSSSYTGFQYYSGGRDKDGIVQPYANNPTLLLPVRPGSHPNEAATTPHNGYTFSFLFNTIGDVWNVGQGVKITPRFYFVPKKGNVDPIEVDLYYDTPRSKLIKVGSALDSQTFTRYINLGDSYMNIDPNYLQYAIRYEWDNFLTPQYKTTTTWDRYLRSAMNRNVEIGKGYKSIILNHQTRILVGNYNPSIPVSEAVQRRAVQRWFGQYHIPIAPFIVAAGTNLEELARTKYGGKLDGTEPEFLRGGYIIVNFTITTYKNNDPDTPILSYHSMWDIEGQIRSSTDYYGNNYNFNFGDIIMFESDFSVRTDFGSGGR